MDRVPRLTMHVNKLKFKRSKNFMTRMLEASPLVPASTKPLKDVKTDLGDRVLREVSFTAYPGQLTYILSDNRAERRCGHRGR